MADIIKIKILDDGSLKIETSKVSGANHTNAEGLLREMTKAMGGDIERVKKGSGDHRHTHDGVMYHEH